MVIEPGPQPTSSTRIPGRSSGDRYDAEFSTVRAACAPTTLA
jgi:hypothetical protein